MGRFCSNWWKAQWWSLRFQEGGWFRRIFCLHMFNYKYFYQRCLPPEKSNQVQKVAESRGGRPAVHKAASGLNFQWRNPSECGPPSPPLTKKTQKKDEKTAIESIGSFKQAFFGSIYPINNSGRWRFLIYAFLKWPEYFSIASGWGIEPKAW